MNAVVTDSARYARCIEASKRIEWDIENDVIRGRSFADTGKYLPDGLSLPGAFPALSDENMRLISRIQGRTYANIFGLVERFINAKILELGREHALGDQTKLEALVRFGTEEMKHQALFRRIESMMAQAMPPGYRLVADPDAVAGAVLGKSTWAVLCLTLHIELFTQAHYRQSIEPDADLSELYKDVFLYHWKEESQHAILDELEFLRHDKLLDAAARDRAVGDFIDLVRAVDGILRAQAESDARYFLAAASRTMPNPARLEDLTAGFLRAYRWQYIFSGAEHPHFAAVLGRVLTPEQGARIETALAGLK